MRKAEVFLNGTKVGHLVENTGNSTFRFTYLDSYAGRPISVTMPVQKKEYEFDRFPPFFEGLLPEGVNLDVLLRSRKIDRDDPFSQLIAVGEDMVGAVTVQEAEE